MRNRIAAAVLAGPGIDIGDYEANVKVKGAPLAGLNQSRRTQ
ncbi:hypothetical protein [Methylobacter sp.]|nr:hypothetical protein [Methylobacter sp.]